ncbi:MAG: lysostaphin resistance A-like protein [Planctomycetota bacterium]
MTTQPPGTLRVLRLLARVSLLRLWRSVQIAKAVRQQRAASSQPDGAGARPPSRRKGGNGLMILLVLLMPFMALQAMHLSARAVDAFGAGAVQVGGDVPMTVTQLTYAHIQATDRNDPDKMAALGRRLQRQKYQRTGFGAEQMLAHFRARGADGFRAEKVSPFPLVAGDWHWDVPAARATIVRGIALIALLFGLALLCTSLSANVGDVGREQWSLSWLLTFPVPSRAIVMARAAEYGLVQFFPWFSMFPLLLQVGVAAGWGWLALGPAALGTLALTATNGALRFWAETRLRLRLPLHRVRKVQGACTLVGLVLLATAMLPCISGSVPDWMDAAAAAMPDLALVLPYAWPCAAFATPSLLLVGLLWTVLLVALGVRGAAAELRHGSVRSGGVDRAAARSSDGAGARWLRGMVGKDVRLLLRDWAFLTQTLLVPLVLVGLQVAGIRGNVRWNPSPMPLAWFVGAAALTGGCFQTLSGEGRALWMLYTMPVSLHRALGAKVRLWAGVGTAYAGLALLLIGGARWSWSLVPDLLLMAAGLWGCAHLAAGTAALGMDPAADHVPRQLKARYVYLYMALAGTFVPALMTEDWSQRTAALVVFGTLAFAMWQRVRERIPYLLDPVTLPQPGLSVFEASAAVSTFFVVMVLTLVAFSLHAERDTDDAIALSLRAVFVAFAIAGAVTLALFLLLMKLRGVAVARELGLRARSAGHALGATALGAAVGAAVGALGLGYRALAYDLGWFDPPVLEAGSGRWLLLLAVVAAPVVEEVLFRGMLFQALRRTVSVAVAAGWSALLFAVLHPRESWLPVFVLGLCAALLVQRTRFLPAAIAAHAVYNALLVGTLIP